MKRRSLSLPGIGFVVLCLASSQCMAEVMMGFKAGASFASQHATGSVLEGVDRPVRSGFATGAVLEVSAGDIVSIRAEPMYAQKGSQINFPSGFESLSNDLNLDYFVFPVNLKASLDHTSLRPFAFVGPYFGFALSGEHVLKSDGTSLESDHKDFDFGLDVGIGTDVRLDDTVSITIDARYSHGLINVINSQGDASFKNRGVVVLGGVLFRL